MRVYLDSLGCRVNEAEREAWAAALGARGHRSLPAPPGADLVVLNSCAVTRAAARKTRQAVARLRRACPAARVVVVGCYPDLERRRDGADLVLGNRDKDDLVARLEAWWSRVRPEPAGQGRVGRALPLAGGAARTRAFVKVQDGCRHRCTYCAVTLARGEERSRALDAVVAEVASRVAAGAREVVLTGIHLGGYGGDLGPGVDLASLVRGVLADARPERLRLSSLEPWTVTTELLGSWRDPRLLPHLHLPVQSGSDPVLRRMGRRGSAAALRELVAQVRQTIPGVTLTTDVIVGFPGEGPAELAQTARLVEELGFADLHVFPFSPRPGTAAARLAGQVSRAERRRRSQVMRALAEGLRLRHARGLVGEVRPVLWERAALRDGVWEQRGYTPGYVRVRAVGTGDRRLQGRVTATRLVGVDADGGLEGTPLDGPVGQATGAVGWSRPGLEEEEER